MPWEDFRVNKRLDSMACVPQLAYALIAEIDGAKHAWKFSNRLLPQAFERLTHGVIITSTGASNRIEGNQLTDVEVEKLYQNLRVKRFSTRDEQEVAGYLECLGLVFEHYQEISVTEGSILKLHADMLTYSEKDARHKGGYKFGPNRVEAKDATGAVVQVIFDPTPPYLVKKEMQELIDWYHWALDIKKQHPLILIANFIFEYLAIHPFQDGNGRTSRLLTNLMLLQQGYFFTQVASHEKIIEANKFGYYQALNKAQVTWKTQTEDISAWLLFFLNVVKQQSETALSLVSADSIDALLSEKQLALWHWAQTLDRAFSRQDAVRFLGFPERTVESIIKRLLVLKRLEKLGQGRATRYRTIA